MTNYIRPILKPTGVNTGGVNPIKFVFIEEVESFTVTDDLIATITLKSGEVWKYLYATDGSISMDGKEEDSPAGLKYIYEINMMIPKDIDDVELGLMEMNNRGMIIMVKYKNGYTRLFGSIDNPMRKKGKIKWPEDTEGYNGTKLTLYGEFSQPAAYYPSMDYEAPFQPD
jgi:hypothetical protein